MVNQLPSWTNPILNENIIKWNDGFIPSGSHSREGYIIKKQDKEIHDLLVVIDDILPKNMAEAIYKSGIKDHVWGVYVTTEDLHKISNNELNNIHNRKEFSNKLLAIVACYYLFIKKANNIFQKDWEKNRIHGIGVWVITSDIGDIVDYHIDYAEMFRYQTNIIYPPMYGGTLHLSNFKKDSLHMDGGDFYVNKKGLENYAKHGYKNKLNHNSINNNITLKDKYWKKIKYTYNRGILCDGNYPHFSSRIDNIYDIKTNKTIQSNSNKKRVVMGFNIFNYEIGPFAAKYPEHSKEFNRYIKISQLFSKKKNENSLKYKDKNNMITTNIHTKENNKNVLDDLHEKNITKESLQKNIKLKKFLLYLLKKSKEKNIPLVAS